MIRFAFLLCSCFPLALAANTDSLEAALQRRPSSLDSVKIIQRLFLECRKNDFPKAMSYARAGLEISRSINYKAGIGDGLANTGFIHYYQNDYPEALKHYLAALEIKEALNDKAGISDCCYVIGKIQRIQGNTQKALEYSFRALQLKKELGDRAGESSVLNGIGNIYLEDKNYSEALKYYRLRLGIHEALRDTGGVASVYNNIAAALSASGEQEEALRNNLQALDALSSMRRDTGSWYMKKFKAGVLNSVAENYGQLGETEKALSFARRALSLVENTKAGKELRVIYATLAALHATQRDFTQAYQHQQKYIETSEALLDEERVKQMADMQAKYETEKTEKELAVANEERALQRLQIQQQVVLVVVLCGLLVLVAAAAWIIRGRNKLKQQKEQFRLVIEAEEKERRRIAMELHDGLGQLLSTARLNVSGLDEAVQGEDAEFLETSKNLIDEACQEVRNVSHNLMPAALIRLGLAAALRELAAKTGKAESRLFTSGTTSSAESSARRKKWCCTASRRKR